MRIPVPVVLIASVSPDDGLRLETKLNGSGWDLQQVGNAHDAARRLNGNGNGAVLVIDSGLLEMAHDGQWRELQRRYPNLGTVVRCLLPLAKTGAEPAIRKSGRTNGSSTFRVHPDDAEGVGQAVRSLSVSGVGSK